jgi:hypothetical protein
MVSLREFRSGLPVNIKAEIMVITVMMKVLKKLTDLNF